MNKVSSEVGFTSWVLIEDGSEFTIWRGDMLRVITRLRRPDTLDGLAEQRRVASLIAAAPALYEALKYARNLIGPDEVIDAALSLANGEPESTPTDAPKEQSL